MNFESNKYKQINNNTKTRMSVRKDMTPFTLVVFPRSRRHLDINSLLLTASNSEFASFSLEIMDGGLKVLFLR